MENNKERDEAYRKSLNEVANLQAILKDLLGMDVNFIPKFKKEDTSHLQAEKDKQRERLETQMFLKGLRAKDSLNKQREDLKVVQQRQDILSKGLQAINKVTDSKKDDVSKEPKQNLYRIVFRVLEQKPLIISKEMYENLFSDTIDNNGFLHGEVNDERVSVRPMDILHISKV